jgi:uncharacterized membrane protein YeaQ/YmgE (transglycosylase-associated protein family)
MNLFKFGKIRATARCCFSAKMLWQAAIGTNLIFLTGCRGAPSINLLGSFFPGWMLCMILGVIGALVLRQIFTKVNIHAHLPLPAFVYFCLWVFITLLSWLLFFRS